MTQISAKHLQTILEVIHTANAHLEELDTFRCKVLEAIQNTIRIDSASFFLFDENMTPSNPVAFNIREKYLHLYMDHFFRFNHFDPTHGCVKAKPAVTDSNLLPFSEFKKSYFYNEFLKTHNVHRQMVLYLQSNRKLLGFIGIHRSDERAGFKDWELAIAETMSPLLSQSLEKAQVFQKTRSDQIYFETILNRTTVGVLLVSYDLEPLFTNNMAKELFRRMKRNGVAFRSSGDKSQCIPLFASEGCAKLKSRLIQNPYPLTPPTMQKSIKLSSDDSFTFTIELLDQPAPGISTPFFLVTIDKEVVEGNRINEHKLKNDYGFTKREIELVHFLFKGLKNQEIAELLCITEGTVKNHLRNIFEKMGVTTRTSLIYEVLSL